MRATTSLLLALSVLAAVGCAPDADSPAAAEPAPTPTPTAAEPTPEPEPEPEPPPPVVGTVEVLPSDLSPVASGLQPDGSSADQPVATDEDAVDGAVAAATAWVDAHLTDLQAGGPGLLADLDLTGDVAELSTLTDPDHPVTAASYAVMVGVRGTPEWLRVQARVAREGAGTAEATFVFLPGDGGAVRLLSAATGPAASTAGTP